MQDIVPEYERSNPLWVKMETTYGALSEHKHALLQAFQKIDQNGTGALSKKDFAKGLRDVDQTCKLSTPRVLLDDMIEEAAHMFCPERNPSDPQDVVYYKDFVSALQRPSPRPHQTVEELCESSRPAARMARTARFIERHRQHDFSLFERMKAHIIQNDLRSLLSLRRGLDPGSGTRETFLRLDADRDGVIGKQDLRQRLLDLGMPVRDENLELILSYCGTEKRGGIDFPAFVKSFEANGRGWFHPFNPHKRLPSPPFRLRADQTSPAYAKTPPSRKVCVCACVCVCVCVCLCVCVFALVARCCCAFLLFCLSRKHASVRIACHYLNANAPRTVSPLLVLTHIVAPATIWPCLTATVRHRTAAGTRRDRSRVRRIYNARIPGGPRRGHD